MRKTMASPGLASSPAEGNAFHLGVQRTEWRYQSRFNQWTAAALGASGYRKSLLDFRSFKERYGCRSGVSSALAFLWWGPMRGGLSVVM